MPRVAARPPATAVTPDEHTFLAEVPEDGRARANGPIRRALGWDDTKYEAVKVSLIEKNLIVRAQGRGGAVKRKHIAAAATDAQTPEPSESRGWSADERALFKFVPASGDSIGNKRLRETLGWDEPKYWTVRDGLEKKNAISKGRGRGGSVYRLRGLDTAHGNGSTAGGGTDATEETQAEETRAEVALYAPFQEFLLRRARDELGLSRFVIQRTAFAGRKKTGGKWTRPDFALVYRPDFNNLPDKLMEAHSYEIKLPEDAISGVYEATAHSRNVHRAYLAVFTGDNVEWVDTDEYDRVKSECERLGIGFIRFEDAEDVDTYEVLVEASPKRPEHDNLDEFLETQLSDENRRKIRSWFN